MASFKLTLIEECYKFQPILNCLFEKLMEVCLESGGTIQYYEPCVSWKNYKWVFGVKEVLEMGGFHSKKVA